jgi:hypothetical protein
MSSTINADTTNGVVVTSDTSGEIKLQSAGADIATVSNTGIEMHSGMALTGDGAGKILQVISGEKGSTFTGTSVVDNGGYFIDVTGYSATITPSSTSSRILVMVHAYVGQTTVASGYQQSLRIKQGTRYPFLGTSEGSRPVTSARISNYTGNTYAMMNISGSWIDSPSSTSALTYQVQIGGYGSAPIVYLNRQETFQVGANNYDTIPLSTITLMEIAG